MIVYSENELKEHVAKLKNSTKLQTGLNKIYGRDFVDSIRKFCFNGEAQQVFIVCGFRATGKTFGLLQAIEDFDNTIYFGTT